MEYDKNICPIIDVDGVIESGKQFDLDITLPDGIVKKYHIFIIIKPLQYLLNTLFITKKEAD